MFIPNYGALQLAKTLAPDIFREAYNQGVLLTTEETLMPFLRMIRIAWTNYDQARNQEKIVKAAQAMIDRVADFAAAHAAMGRKLEEATKEEKVIDNELPAVISDFMEKLVEQWNEWDKKSRARLKKEYDWLGYREFIKKWKYSGYEKMRETDEQIEKENRRNAKAICLNLWRRVKETVGEVTDCHGLEVVSGNEFEGCVINGMVYGTDGACVVESVSAGGYNIQKWHIRTLVKRWKK